MIHRGKFVDIKNNTYTVTILTAGGIATTELEFSGEPFVASIEGGDILYKPARYTSATLGLICRDNNYLFDVYSGKPQSTKIVVSRGGEIIFAGYAEPTLYSVGYENNLEELRIDCLDGLATLQYFKYEPIAGTPGIHKLGDIIKHCVKKCHCYSKIVYDIATRIKDNGASIWSALISEQNFISTDTDDKDGQDTMTFQEVLEAVCRWACVTAISAGDAVWLVDYDSIIDDTNKVEMLDIASGDVTPTTYAELGNIYNISASSYAEGGAQLSLDAVYSKVSISNDNNTFDAILSDPFEGAENITANDDEITNKSNPGDYRACYGDYVTGTGDDSKMLVMLDRIDGAQNDPSFNAIFAKYYKNNNFKLYHYMQSGSSFVTTTAGDNECNYTTSGSTHGAFLARMDVTKLDALDYEDYAEKWVHGVMSLDEILAQEEKSSVSFSDVIILNNPSTAHITNDKAANYPYFETTAEMKNSAFFGGENAFLLVSGTVIIHDQQGHTYAIPDGEIDPGNGRYKIDVNYAHILARLEWSGKYFNGKEWQDTPCTFSIPYVNSAKRFDAVLYKKNKIVNTVTWRDGIDEEGFKIPLPEGGSILSGQPKITIYAPLDLGYYKTVIMLLQDFKISAVVSDPTFSGNLEDDTIYTNVIDENNANEMDEIEFSVCTYDNKKPSFNAVAFDYNNKRMYIDKTRHDTLCAKEKGTETHDGTISTDGAMRQEEHLLWRCVNQYSAPSTILELSLKDDIPPYYMLYERNLKHHYVIDSVEKDYRNCNYNYKIIEKK